MDNSQSSDVFSQISSEVGRKSPTEINTYKSAFLRIKQSFSKQLLSVKCVNEILQDCDLCIHQCLDSVLYAIDAKLGYHILCDYIKDAVWLLQMLSSYIKRVLESIALACCNMETYPTITGNIILSVFSHCKDSDCLYGDYLNKVEIHLKDLFRTCHELQLTYLMTMEKHFTFDLSEKAELNVLLEALDINLKIGDIVQVLDIKTMAEQWKAYTAICEKYSRYLLDKSVCNECTKLLIKMIRSNMKNAIESDQSEKAVLRSTKVTSFCIKILSKIIFTFKNANIHYEDVLDLLIYLYTFNPPYLETTGKSIQFSNLVESNITVSLEALLNQLVKEKDFIKLICYIDETKIQKETYLGFIILLTTVMKKQINVTEELHKDVRILLIKQVFWLLPKGHTWFNMTLKFQTTQQTNNLGLFEFMLKVTAAFAMMLDSLEFKALERIMYECLLSSDCYSGVFAGSLLVLLLRSCDPKLLQNTLLSLLNVYRTLCTKTVFHTSPQKYYLSYTLNNLFRYCSCQDKLLIFEEFNIQERSNADVWISLGISNLPNDVKANAERLILDKFSKRINRVPPDNDAEFQELIRLIELAASCESAHSKITELLRLWDTICHKCVSITETNTHSISFFRYIEALAKLTDSVKECIPIDERIKVFNIIGTILKTGNSDLLYILFRLFCELYKDGKSHSNLLREVVQISYTNDDTQVQTYIYFCAYKYRNVITVISALPCILTVLQEFKKSETERNVLKSQMECVSEYKFVHKCFKTPLITLSSSSKNKSNFDLADIDSLFDYDSDCEPASKKVKLSDTEIEDLISKLEENASHLYEVKENILRNEHKLKISDVCVKLKNILEK